MPRGNTPQEEGNKAEQEEGNDKPAYLLLFHRWKSVVITCVAPALSALHSQELSLPRPHTLCFLGFTETVVKPAKLSVEVNPRSSNKRLKCNFILTRFLQESNVKEQVHSVLHFFCCSHIVNYLINVGLFFSVVVIMPL